jgi:hypothetical protein
MDEDEVDDLDEDEDGVDDEDEDRVDEDEVEDKVEDEPGQLPSQLCLSLVSLRNREREKSLWVVLDVYELRTNVKRIMICSNTQLYKTEISYHKSLDKSS